MGKKPHYDNTNGNLLKTIASGTGADPVVTEYGYTNVSGNDWSPLWRKSMEKIYYQANPNAPDRHSQYLYDTSGNLEQKILFYSSTESSIWSYDYYANGNLHHEYDANGNPPTAYTYSVAGTFAETITNPAGHVT